MADAEPIPDAQPIHPGGGLTADELRLARNAGVENARAEAAERRAYALERIAVAGELIAAYEPYLNEQMLGKLLKAGVAKTAHDVLIGKIEVKRGNEAAALITAMATAGRLEAGQATSRTENITGEELAERIKGLRDAADEKLAEITVAENEAEQLEKVRKLG
jgi:hypothetical protein